MNKRRNIYYQLNGINRSQIEPTKTNATNDELKQSYSSEKCAKPIPKFT